MQDQLTRFVFDSAPARGATIRLDAAWQAMLSRRDYPPRLRTLLGELTAAGALLAANLKFDGTLILQLHGNAALQLLVVEVSQDTLRATARWEGDVPDHATLADLLGQGRFVITLDPKTGGDPYQGIVALEGDSVAAMLEHYMQRSEQVETRLLLAADEQVATGLLLQKLPTDTDNPDDWPRVVLLADTLGQAELLAAPSDVLLHRLFHEETLQVFEPTHCHFACTCSRERVGGMLKMLGREEVDAVVAEQGSVSVQCEFCNQNYVFDEDDMASLFPLHLDLPTAAPTPLH